MKQQMCSRCGERPAVVFIQKMENDKVTPEGLCIKCARGTQYRLYQSND